MPSYNVSMMSDEAALAEFLRQRPNSTMVTFLAKKASAVIDCSPASDLPQSNAQNIPSPPLTPVTQTFAAQDFTPELASLEAFITRLINKSNVGTNTLMCTTIYLDRLRQKLPKEATGLNSARHRVFLAALILAAKYLNDSSPKNKHWAKYSGFSIAEVNLMERQMLWLMRWDPRIEEDDLYFHLEEFLTPIKRQHLIRMQKELQQKRPSNASSNYSPRRSSSTSTMINDKGVAKFYQNYTDRRDSKSTITAPSPPEMVPSLSSSSSMSSVSVHDEGDYTNIPLVDRELTVKVQQIEKPVKQKKSLSMLSRFFGDDSQVEQPRMQPISVY